MKKLLVLGLSVSSLTASAEFLPSVPNDLNDIDTAVACVNDLEMAQQSAMTQSMLMYNHVRNLEQYGVERLMQDTPNISSMTNLLKNNGGGDFDFNSLGITQETYDNIYGGENSEILLADYNENKSALDQEMSSVGRLINRGNMMGGGVYGGGITMNAGGGFPGTYIGGFNPLMGELNIYYNTDENNPDIELQYDAVIGGFKVSTADVADLDSEQNMNMYTQNNSIIDHEAAGIEIKVHAGGWGQGNFQTFEIIDSETGEQIKMTSNPYEVCSEISSKLDRDVAAQASETETIEETAGPSQEFLEAFGSAEEL